VIRRRVKGVHVELAWLGEGDLVIEPVVKEQFIARAHSTTGR